MILKDLQGCFCICHITNGVLHDRSNVALELRVLKQGVGGVGEDALVGQPGFAVRTIDVTAVHPQYQAIVANGLFAARD